MFLSLRKVGWVLLSMLVLIRPSWAAEAVAMVTDIKGAAALAEKGGPEKLALLAYLMPDSEIQIESGARVVVTYFSKPQEFVFTGPAKVRINADGPKVLTGGAAETRKLGPEKVSTAKKFTAMQREKLSQATFEMRGTKTGVRLLGPVETAVLSTAPEFIWSGPKSADEYRLTLTDAEGKIIQDVKTSQPSWQPPKTVALKRGASYQWKVETTLRSGETLSAGGKFSVLDEGKAKKIIEARPKPGAEFSERVLYAARMETEGLMYEAIAEWQLLLQERPDDLVLQDRSSR